MDLMQVLQAIDRIARKRYGKDYTHFEARDMYMELPHSTKATFCIVAEGDNREGEPPVIVDITWEEVVKEINKETQPKTVDMKAGFNQWLIDHHIPENEQERLRYSTGDLRAKAHALMKHVEKNPRDAITEHRLLDLLTLIEDTLTKEIYPEDKHMTFPTKRTYKPWFFYGPNADAFKVLTRICAEQTIQWGHHWPNKE